MKGLLLASLALLVVALAATRQAIAEATPPAQQALAALDEDAPETASEITDNAASDAATDEKLTARGRYNLGLEQLRADDSDAAADAFLTARDEAGPDPVLRYRAAFNLGFALADGVAEDAPPEQAIEQLRRSAAWFNDALRLAPPDDEDARVNLELVSRRILELADQLNADDRLEARLDRLIDDQRGLRDQVRGLLANVAAEQASAEPLGFKSEFDSLASRERTLMAEVGDCIDRAAEERLFIEQTPEAERTPEQQRRAYQLQAASDYLERARQSLGDARRRLRRLEGERGHRRADAALAELKRAREQLLDPLTVLNAVARDELELLNQTAALATLRAADADQPPAWLTAKHLGERQESIAARTGGLLGGFEAAAPTMPAESVAEQRLAKAVEEAVPLLDQGLADMRDAIAALAADRPSEAATNQQQALKGVQQAIELFADAKGLIELAYASQQGIVTLLNPAEEADRELADADRADAVFALTQENQRRLARLATRLQEEQTEALAQTDADSDATSKTQARQAAEQRYRRAEELRTQAQTGLAKLSRAIETVPATQAASAAAGESLQALDELRRLFFSVIEHLQALVADQADTHDRTATLQFEASADLADELTNQIGAVADRQNRHGQLGDALAAALAQQADAAGTPPPDDAATPEQAPSQEQQAAAQQAAEKLAEAAAEVRKAGGRMHSAGTLLADAAPKAATMSPELEPALDDQVAALEHLEKALQALAPPDGDRNQEQQEQQQSGDQSQAQQQPQPSEQEQMSQRQALRRLQAIRDREAERQRRRTNPTTPEPVEKDW